MRSFYCIMNILKHACQVGIKKMKKIINLRLKEFLLLFLMLVLFVNLINSWMKLKERINLIKETENKVIEEEKFQENLERELAQAESDVYIEKQAREKLNMGKDGEIVVLLPTPVLSPSPTAVPDDRSANWQKWMRLFW